MSTLYAGVMHSTTGGTGSYSASGSYISGSGGHYSSWSPSGSYTSGSGGSTSGSGGSTHYSGSGAGAACSTYSSSGSYVSASSGVSSGSGGSHHYSSSAGTTEISGGYISITGSSPAIRIHAGDLIVSGNTYLGDSDADVVSIKAEFTSSYGASFGADVSGSSTSQWVGAALFGSNVTVSGSITGSNGRWNLQNGGLVVTGNVDIGGYVHIDTALTIDSTTINAAEIGVLDGVTAGTAAASKAVVLDANKAVTGITSLTASTLTAEHLFVNEFHSQTRTQDILEISSSIITVASGASDSAHADGAGLHVSGAAASFVWDHSNSRMDLNKPLAIDTSLTVDSITLTDTELGYLDGLTLGTVAASKAVTVDANKDVGDFRHVTAASITGSKGKFDMANGVLILTGSVISTGDTTVTEVSGAKGRLDLEFGVFALSGNIDAGGTLSCDTSFTIDTTSISAAEIGVIDGVTAGTATASKAVVLDGSKDIATLGAVTLASVTGSKGRFDVANGNLLLTGTLDVGGASLFNGNATFGVDDTGVDVRIFSATTNEGILYDASEDELGLLLTTKLSFHDIGGDENILASANGHLEVNAGTTLDMTAPTTEIHASTVTTIDSPIVSVESSTSARPRVIIKNTTNDANAGVLRFVKDKGAAGAADDNVGVIEFYGDDANQDQVLFGRIRTRVAVHTDGQEGGKMHLSVASHDGELNHGIVITDGNAEDEVDVTIGNGAASVTTTAGLLTATGEVKVGTAAGSGADAFLYTAGTAAHVGIQWDADGNTEGTLIGGADDHGVDFKFFGETSGKYVQWDMSGDELVLASSAKLSFHDAAGDENIVASSDGHLEVNAGTTLDMTAPTVDVNASTAVTIDGPSVIFADSTSQSPLIQVKNTTNDTNGAIFRFVKDKGAAGADNDILGQIQFYGDDANQDQVHFANIVAQVSEADNGQEGGKLILQVATHDGEMVNAAIFADGQNEDEVELILGNNSNGATIQVDSTSGLTFNHPAVSGYGNDEGAGDILRDGGGTLTAGKLYFMPSGSTTWTETRAATDTSGSGQLLGIAMGSSPTNNGLLIRGFFDVNSYLSGTFKSGSPVYMGTAGAYLQMHAPSGSGEILRVLGYCTSTANVIYFNPSTDFIEFS